MGTGEGNLRIRYRGKLDYPGLALVRDLCPCNGGGVGGYLDERDPGGESVGWKGGTWTLRKPSWKETKLLQLPLEIALFNMQSTAVFRRHLSIHHPMQIPTLGKRSPCKSLDSPNQVCVGDSSVPKEQHRAGQATAYHSQRLDKEKKKKGRDCPGWMGLQV